MADRYCAMRGELLEPGGCSVCPISPAAAATIRAPKPVPVGNGVTADAPAAGAPVIAPCRVAAKSVPLVAVEEVAGARRNECGVQLRDAPEDGFEAHVPAFGRYVKNLRAETGIRPALRPPVLPLRASALAQH